MAPPPCRETSRMRGLPSFLVIAAASLAPVVLRRRAALRRLPPRPRPRRRRDAARRHARPRPLAHAVARARQGSRGARPARGLSPGLVGPARAAARMDAPRPRRVPAPVTADRVTWVAQLLPPAGRAAQPRRHTAAAAHGRWRARPEVRRGRRRVPAQVDLPRAVAPESDEARMLLDALQGTFNREERLMLAEDYFAVYTPSVDADERDRMPVRAITIHEGPGRNGSPTYFVELERRYPRRQPERLRWCDEVTYMAGWVRRARRRPAGPDARHACRDVVPARHGPARRTRSPSSTPRAGLRGSSNCIDRTRRSLGDLPRAGRRRPGAAGDPRDRPVRGRADPAGRAAGQSA